VFLKIENERIKNITKRLRVGPYYSIGLLLLSTCSLFKGFSRQGLNCGELRICGPDLADLKFSIRITSQTTKKIWFSESL
jgi:hypothetical protein